MDSENSAKSEIYDSVNSANSEILRIREYAARTNGTGLSPNRQVSDCFRFKQLHKILVFWSLHLQIHETDAKPHQTAI